MQDTERVSERYWLLPRLRLRLRVPEEDDRLDEPLPLDRTLPLLDDPRDEGRTLPLLDERPEDDRGV
ncbi:MAG: hypothetical protein D6685_01800 [Bacteroidetes bacterium]|nr:MAG: hypothetical protein D6685_01800 [Bacteroidota bacterium]